VHDFVLLEPESLEEAISLRSKHQDSTYIAGGTNLLYMVRRGVRRPKYLINLKSIRNLDSVEYNKEGLRIGPLAKISALEHSEIVRDKFPVLSQAASKIASPQIRNMGTFGGNLCQEVWCWYLLEGFNCWLNDGKYCYAPAGDNRYHHSLMGGYHCFAVHPSDLGPVLKMLDAKITVAGLSGVRTISVDQLLPGFTKVEDMLKVNCLKPDELITEVQIPNMLEGSKSIFIKSAIRESFDFALSSVALLMMLEGDYCKDVRIVLGGVATKPYRARKAEDLLINQTITEDLVDNAVESVFDKVIPLSGNAYRIELSKALVRKAIRHLAFTHLDEELVVASH